MTGSGVTEHTIPPSLPLLLPPTLSLLLVFCPPATAAVVHGSTPLVLETGAVLVDFSCLFLLFVFRLIASEAEAIFPLPDPAAVAASVCDDSLLLFFSALPTDTDPDDPSLLLPSVGPEATRTEPPDGELTPTSPCRSTLYFLFFLFTLSLPAEPSGKSVYRMVS